MKVLVAFASRHHSTEEIAGTIADELRRAGIEIDLRQADTVHDTAGYHAVVLGSAVYFGAWLPEAWRFVNRFNTTLESVPVWLFSSGPLGRDEPKPAGSPSRIAELKQLTLARDHRIFTGKLDRKQLSLSELLVTRVVRPPEGDFRDWLAVRQWAREIAGALLPQPAV